MQAEHCSSASACFNSKVSTKVKGWKWDYFHTVSVLRIFPNYKYVATTFKFWESTIYLAIWPFSDLKQNMNAKLKFYKVMGNFDSL